MAITVDDLPYAAAAASVSEGPSMAEIVNGKLLNAFRRHHVPVTSFVIQKRVEAIGV